MTINYNRALVTAALLSSVPLLGMPARAQNTPTMASSGTDSLVLARKYTTWFMSGQADSLWSHQSADAKKNTSAAQLLETLMQLSGQIGVEQKVLEERFVRRLGKTQYWRTSQFSDGGEPFMIRFALTPEGELAGFGFNPRSQAPPVDK